MHQHSDMASHLVLCEHLGPRVSCPHQPVEPWTGQVDLSEIRIIGACNPSHLDLPYPRFLVREVDLPAWLDVEDWLAHQPHWAATWGHPSWGFQGPPTWPENWQRFLARSAARDGAPYPGRPGSSGVQPLEHANRLALIELLATRDFRSTFRRSLREQAEVWLSTWWAFETGVHPSGPDYLSPLSPSQWRCLVRPHHRLRARRLEAALSRGRIPEMGVEIDDAVAERSVDRRVA